MSGHHFLFRRSPFIFGTNGDDSITGTERSDIIFTGRGDDVVDAGAGNDLVFGGRGADTVMGGSGNDRVFGHHGADSVDGGAGNDYLDGGRDNDTLHGGAGRDRLDGGHGNDELDGGAGADTVDGGKGDDRLLFSYEPGAGCLDWYSGGVGFDTLVLNLTAAQWADPEVQADLLAYLDSLETVPFGGGHYGHWHGHGGRHGHEGRHGHGNHFVLLDSLNLAVRQIEALEVYVDGVLIDPRDPGGARPVAVDDSFAVTEGVPITGDVAQNDSFAAGATFTLDSAPARGVLVLNGDGTFSFDPAGDFDALSEGESGTETFTYTLGDANGSTSGTVTLTVTGTNDAPVVAVAITAAAPEDGAVLVVDLLDGATDVDGGAVLSVANVAALPAGVTLAGAILSVDPADAAFQHLNLGDSAVLTITYDVVDEFGASVAQTATITITGTNDAPTVAAALLDATNEDTPITFDLLTGAADVDDGAVLHIEGLIQTGGRGVAHGVTGTTLNFDPTAFQEMDDGETEDFTFAFNVVDEHGAATPQSITITVEGRNDAPVATALSFVTDEDQPSIMADLLATASDVDAPDTLSTLNVVQTAGRAVTPVLAGHTLTIDPAPFQDLALGESEVVSFDYQITDGDAVITNSVSFTIEGRNDAPVVNSAIGLQVAVSGDEFTFVVPAGTITDIDASDTLSYAAVQDDGTPLPTWLSFDAGTQTFTGIPSSGDTGLVRVAVTATDPHGATATVAFWIAQVDTVLTGTPDMDALTGGAPNELLYGLEGNDDLTGSVGSDIYVNRAGDGFDVIDDNGNIFGADVLLLEGASPADVALSGWGLNESDLLVRRADGGAVLLVGALGAGGGDRIEAIAFDDGTVWTMAQVRQMLLEQSQTAGDDTVVHVNGPAAENDTTLEGGAGNDFLSGQDGSDTYVFNAGDGRDVIEDNGYADTDRVEIHGYASSDAQFSLREGTAADVVIDLPGGDQIILRNTLLEAVADEIEEIHFADDGVTLSMADLRLMFIENQQTDGDDAITGFSVNPDEVFEGGSGNDFISGLDGSDTYIFNAGDGVDRIEDNGYGDTDVLDIRGYASTDAIFTRNPGGPNDLRILLPDGDEVVIIGTLNEGLGDEIEQITFDGDGAVLDMAAVRAIILAQDQTAGADHVTGWSYDETFEAGTGDDFIIGGDGSDTYVFNIGDGNDTVDDNGYADTDVVRFTGHSSTDAVFSIVAGTTADLLVRLPGGDSVTLVGGIGSAQTDQIESFVFDGDAVTLTLTQVRAMVMAQQTTAGDDLITGLNGAFDETLAGGQGNDSLIGRDGSDTYVFNAGDGSDTIQDGGFADTDVLGISGYSSTDAVFQATGLDDDSYVIVLGGGDRITVRNGAGSAAADTIEQISFDGDGVTLTNADIWAQVVAGLQTAGADIIDGPNLASDWTPGAGNDQVSGGTLTDTYNYAAGDGYDVYTEIVGGNVVNVSGYSSTDVVQVLTDPNAASAVVLDFGGGDRIALSNDATFTINFAGDGVVWTPAEIDNQALTNGVAIAQVGGSIGDDTLTAVADSFLSGGAGNDTYEYASGTGFATIFETGHVNSSGADVLNITGYASTDMTVQIAPTYYSGSGILLDFGGGDLIWLDRTLSYDPALYGIDSFHFDGDGVTLTFNDLVTTVMTQQQTAGDDTVTGFAGGQVLEGGLGNDTLSGGGGSDTYIFNAGDGDDEINENGSADSDLLLINGYASTDAAFSTVPGNSNDLVITLAGGDRITIRATLDGNYYDAVETITFAGDGVSFTMADLSLLVVAQSQTAGDDLIQGLNTADTLAGGLGDDTIFGGDGADTYVFNAGDGSDLIEDNGSGDTDALLITGYASTDAGFANVQGSPLDLVISLPGGDRIELRNVLGEDFYDGIDSITFDGDGVSYSMAQLRALLIAQDQSAGNDTVNGFGQADTIEGGAGDDVLFGGDGADTYIFNAGDGSDRIEDNGSGDDDVVLINGYSFTDASFGYGPGSATDLIISFAGGDQVQLINVLAEDFYDGIASVTFDGDAVTLNMQDIRNILFAQQQTAGDDTVTGSTLHDVLDAGPGDDYVTGLNGGDHYYYSYGDGNDTFDDNGAGDLDRIIIDGVNSADVTFATEAGAPNTLVIGFANGEVLTVVNTIDGDFYDGIEEVTFADDGVTLSMADIRATILAQAGTAGDDAIYGYNATLDTLEGGAGDDFLSGGERDDTYIFSTGDGTDVVQEGGYGDADVFIFTDVASGDITVSQLTLNNNALVIEYGAGDSVTVIGGAGATNSYFAIESYQFTDVTLTHADMLLLI